MKLLKLGLISLLLTFSNLLASEVIYLEVVSSFNGINSEPARIGTSPNVPASFEFNEEIKVLVTPAMNDSNSVLLSSKVYFSQGGKFELVAEPKVLVNLNKPTIIEANHGNEKHYKFTITAVAHEI